MKSYWAASLLALSAPLQIFGQPGMPAQVAPSQINASSQASYKPAILRSVGIDQKMGAQVPLDLPFLDEAGHDVTLRQYFGQAGDSGAGVLLLPLAVQHDAGRHGAGSIRP